MYSFSYFSVQLLHIPNNFDKYLTNNLLYDIFTNMQYTAYLEEEFMGNYDFPIFTTLVEISRLSNILQNTMDIGMDDITSKQWLPLMVLGKCEDTLNLNQLAEKCGITRQSAKQLIDKLVEEDLVSIKKSDFDKRNILIYITEKGRNWGIYNFDRNVQFVQELFSDIPSEDILVFSEVQRKLIDKLVNMKSQLKEGNKNG